MPQEHEDAPTASESYSPRVDRERTLRWQLSITTTAPPDHDERMGERLFRALQNYYGENFKLVKLRTKD